MLFYDEAEADQMFEAAGYREFEHHIQQSNPGSPKAITTVATVPAADDEREATGESVEGKTAAPGDAAAD
jgi:hypothetical protein